MPPDLPIPLRKGKAKTLLESSRDSALLAIEIYNKPRTAFRSEAYISLMIMAWTKLLHTIFHCTIGEKYFHKKKNGRYEIVDGERKAWELSACIKHFKYIPEPVRVNLQFFIKLRNKIEHRHVNKKEVDVLIFGECQAMLFNYETLLVRYFGESYALHESLVYSLQLSQLRHNKQKDASKSALARDVQDIKKYVDDYRTSLSDELFHSPEYSIRLISIPKVSGTSRGDLAVEFINLSQLSEEDKDLYDQITTLIKDKKVMIEGSNVGKLKPSIVCDKVNENLGRPDFLKVHHHTWLYKVFMIRPRKGVEDPFNTDTRFCHYDEAHDDYVYNDEWVNTITSIFQNNLLTLETLKGYYDSKETIDINSMML